MNAFIPKLRKTNDFLHRTHMTNELYQEPSMAIKSYCLSRQDGVIILPASQHINHHQPAGMSYQLADMYQLASFKPQTFFFIFELNGLNIVGMCRNNCRISNWFTNGSLNFIIQYFCGHCPASDKSHQLFTLKTFTYQLVKCTSWQKRKTLSCCQLTNTA